MAVGVGVGRCGLVWFGQVGGMGLGVAGRVRLGLARHGVVRLGSVGSGKSGQSWWGKEVEVRRDESWRGVAVRVRPG